MLLKYNLLPFEKAFIFQILGQDENLSEYVKREGPFRASNGWKVAISIEPEVNLAEKVIYLQGSNSKKDNKIDRTYNLSCNWQRDRAISDVHQALEELVASFKKSQERPKGNPLAYANKLTDYPVGTVREIIVVELF